MLTVSYIINIGLIQNHLWHFHVIADKKFNNLYKIIYTFQVFCLKNKYFIIVNWKKLNILNFSSSKYKKQPSLKIISYLKNTNINNLWTF